jgi:hypothetical protein
MYSGASILESYLKEGEGVAYSHLLKLIGTLASKPPKDEADIERISAFLKSNRFKCPAPLTQEQVLSAKPPLAPHHRLITLTAELIAEARKV